MQAPKVKSFASSVLVSVLAGMAVATEPVAWRVVSVHDGDTIGALCPANECFLISVASSIEEGNIRERI